MATIDILSTISIGENPKAGDLVATLKVNGGATGETFHFQLADYFSERFVIEGSELRVKTPSLFDFESGLTSFNLAISATSEGGSTPVDPASVTVKVTNVNEAPTDLALGGIVAPAVAENAKAGTEVGALMALDPDANETFTFSLTDNAGGRFQIVDNKLVVADGAKFDYETASSLRVTVKVTDAGGLSFEKTLSIGVTDVSEVDGSARNEKLRGTENADIINGGAGNDWIWGNGGNDTINGGSGKDILFGGAGADTFVFDTPFKKGHFDQIRDFKSGEDKILFDLDALKSFKVKASKSDLFGLAKKGKPDKMSSVGLDKVFKEGKLEKKFFTVGTTSKDGNDYVVYNKKNGTVYLDVDGSGGAKPIEILKVKPGAALSFNDFLFI
ncbi:cadherin domain-containing protein [Microvirga calopogonii]|uniref:cadherin domain-containing protein n=1 Tax=Microvirga calopogonii TaxID=2078013 RepID=UPI000E0CC0BF|nr:cadherin domain-containing protein [Microvirga calopogonii]